LKDYIEERAIQIANYIIDENATVRQTAKRFGISKSTVHTVVPKWTVKIPVLDLKKAGFCESSMEIPWKLEKIEGLDRGGTD